MTDASDCQLLERFVTHRDEAAFLVLARRHAALVLRVCRRVLRHEQDAEDVFQATFLLLARRAVLLPWRPSVGPWLSAVAYRLALKARAADRRWPEQLSDDTDPAFTGADPLASAARRELCGLVREEVARLPEKYREPVVLCYLEGKTNDQAARLLGWPVGSMSRRLERARRLLRERLAGRGLALLTIVLCAALATLWPAVKPRFGAAPGPVAEAMRPFQAGPDGQPGLEGLLCQLTEQPPATLDRGLVASLATEAARLAVRIEGHDPGRRREEWRRYSRELGESARDLTGAVEADDRPATLLAAGRLYAVCSHCHHAFRD
jgi:RNA polymerase sigma-70 factor (ECF subfamily)